MKDYIIALGNWTHVQEEVNDLLAKGYQLAGNLVVLIGKDDDGEYAMYYQPMIGERPDAHGP